MGIKTGAFITLTGTIVACAIYLIHRHISSVPAAQTKMATQEAAQFNKEEATAASSGEVIAQIELSPAEIVSVFGQIAGKSNEPGMVPKAEKPGETLAHIELSPTEELNVLGQLAGQPFK